MDSGQEFPSHLTGAPDLLEKGILASWQRRKRSADLLIHRAMQTQDGG
jgi:hypothetical protein